MFGVGIETKRELTKAKRRNRELRNQKVKGLDGIRNKSVEL
jgi:hypothetical protein